MRTITGHVPLSRPRGDYPAYCDYCGTKWWRSKLTLDSNGRLRCPQEGPGMSLRDCQEDAARAQREAAAKEAGRARRTAARGSADIDLWPEVSITTPTGGASLALGGGDAFAGSALHGVVAVELWRGRPFFPGSVAIDLGAATVAGESWSFTTPAMAGYGGTGAFEVYAVGATSTGGRIVSLGVNVRVA